MELTTDIILGIDDYFKQTRVYNCASGRCRYMDKATGKCALKCIQIDETGRCVYYEAM